MRIVPNETQNMHTLSLQFGARCHWPSMSDPAFFSALYRSAPSEYVSSAERRRLKALLESPSTATEADRAFVAAIDVKVRAAESAWRQDTMLDIGAPGSRAARRSGIVQPHEPPITDR